MVDNFLSKQFVLRRLVLMDLSSADMPARMVDVRGVAGSAGEPTLESLMQAAVIAVMGVAIVVSNLLIIAAFLNFKGKWDTT